ncbi:Protein ENL [Camelus dromedarius]|uniref:Protein ENL n=1 Tax=Camelus dromedarius TaxID=9838 RepID=A0A5N4CJU2_CAMDR|nr:Protein ENL [Camelus dromedarius]
MDEETGTEKQPPARPSEPTSLFSLFKEEPRKVCFTYDLFLNLEGNPPVNHLRCEKLTFNNPTIEFRYKLLMAGGVMVMPEGAETVSRPSPDYPMLPTIPLSAFSDPKKTKPSHGSKVSEAEGPDASRESSKACKAHKTTKEHRERPRKDSESRGPSKEPEREQARSAKDAARKLGEGRPPKEEKAPPPKAAFKEPKMALKETKLESMSPKGGPPPPPPPKSSSKRPAAADSPKPSAKKQKKSSSKGSRSAPSTSPRTSSSSFSDKKPAKDKGSAKGEKVKAESEPREIKKPPEVEESNSEDEASFKTESAQSSPSNSSSSSDSSSDSDFEPSQNHSQGQGLEACEQGQEGPLRSMVEDLQSEESDEDDSSSGEEAAGKTNAGRDSRCLGWWGASGCRGTGAALPGPVVIDCGVARRPGQGVPAVMGSIGVHQVVLCLGIESRGRRRSDEVLVSAFRLSFSDSESDNSADSCLPGREPPPPKKPPPPNSKQASGRRSPEPCSKPEKILKRGAYDKVGAQAVMGTGCGAYTDELVELHRRLMALRERNVLQQIVNLIEETGHFNVTNTTFDFDLFSLDETTVRKLQSCLEAVAT